LFTVSKLLELKEPKAGRPIWARREFGKSHRAERKMRRNGTVGFLILIGPFFDHEIRIG
jgi:hypothetical protein